MESISSCLDTSDPEMSRRLLEQAMTEDAIMAYPSFEARGWEGISDLMVTYKQQLPGMRIVLTSNVEEHHGWVRLGGACLRPMGLYAGMVRTWLR